MTNEKLWVFSETFLSEDSNKKGTVMVKTQKCSEQSKKTTREYESWLHLNCPLLKRVFSCFSWIKDMCLSPGRCSCELCVLIPLRVNGCAVWFHKHKGLTFSSTPRERYPQE